MPIRKQVRFFVFLLMTAIFLYMLGRSISEWSKKKVGETQTTKSASEILYPTVTMIPFFEHNVSFAKLFSLNMTKNLTDYNLKTSHIQTDIISIYQKYHIMNGLSFAFTIYMCVSYQDLIAIFRTKNIYLNKSSYSLHPNLFKVYKYLDVNLLHKSIYDGLQEFATYNPPGPTNPGKFNAVSS